MKKKKMLKSCFMAGLCCLCLLAMTPRAWAGTINNNAAEADAVVRVVNAPSVNSSLGVIIDSHAVTNIENKGNRQFPQVGMLGGPAPTSYFGDWKTGPDEWNVFPINLGETWVKDGETKRLNIPKFGNGYIKNIRLQTELQLWDLDKSTEKKWVLCR